MADLSEWIILLILAICVVIGFILMLFQAFFPVFIILTIFFLALCILTQGDFPLLNWIFVGLLVVDIVSALCIIFVLPTEFGQMCVGLFKGTVETHNIVSNATNSLITAATKK